MNRKYIKKILKLFSFLTLNLLFFSCASNSAFKPVESQVANNQFNDGADFLEKNKNRLYSNKDAVLYYLDKGMLNHYANQYANSTKMLEDADRLIAEAFTKSISLEASSYLINDLVLEYGGEDYEDIYINVFNALNYYYMGELENSLVEIRRMNNKLQYLSNKYDAVLTNLQQKALEDNKVELPSNPNTPSKFNNSALARYLGILFYRGVGLYDDARIDRDYLLAAFANAPNVYSYPIPNSLVEELSVPEGMARLNIVAFGGLSPLKKENVLRIPLPGVRWIKIALPEMVSRKSDLSRVEIVFEDGTSHTLELLEDIDAVAKDTFSSRKQFIYIKTIIRASVKGASSSALKIAANEAEGNAALALGIASIFTQAFAEISERADLRISRFFPGKAYIGGINLKPGRYSFKVSYYNANNREIASFVHNDVEVKENALNLIETFSLK
ncbi:MAG: hypothetical protein FWH41_09985 [Treponema sp.]|nr:hypothetical protein [Treponema sp.]MCL2139841.1 hypothetical protein [Treponema sp.]